MVRSPRGTTVLFSAVTLRLMLAETVLRLLQLRSHLSMILGDGDLSGIAMELAGICMIPLSEDRVRGSINVDTLGYRLELWKGSFTHALMQVTISSTIACFAIPTQPLLHVGISVGSTDARVRRSFDMCGMPAAEG